jgi:hypothetical protein
MHALVVQISLSDVEAADARLKSQVVPTVSQAPGFVAGYWTRKDREGIAMAVFESKEAADSVAGRVTEMAPSDAELKLVEVREVIAHA